MQQYPYYDQLAAQLYWQAKKIEELETDLIQLKNELSEVKEQRQIHVDKIEYKFDQLKIERLEGTLNIGISPGGGKQVEEMIVEGKEMELSDPYKSQLFQDAKDQVDGYMNSDCLRDIQNMEEKYRVIFGQEYREAIIDDLRKQIDKRIDYYINLLMKDNNSGVDPAVVAQKVKRDMMTAIERHVMSKVNKEEQQ
ncbi:spore germination protein GerPC [Paenibacillus tarimensis]